MCDSINETLKLMHQGKAKWTFYILQHIHKLNNFLKCCICFELFDKPTKTNCDHLFCKSCINKHMSYYSSEEIAPCPICMQPLAEFESFSLHVEYEEAVGFVKELLKHTTKFQTDIEEPPNFISILEKIEQNTSEEEVELSNKMTNFESDSRYKAILNSRKFLISTDSKVFLSDVSKKPVDDIDTIPQVIDLQTEVNQFDLLLNESKKLKPIKTYESAKKPQKEVITTDIEKSIKIRRRLNNSKALQWLQDTRNNFDKLPTQTETTANLKVSIPKFDLPSISQNDKPQCNSKPNKMNQNKIRRFTRSMGGSSKVTQAKTRERHSIAACDNLSIPMDIEQFSNEEKKTFTKGLQELELQCLNSIDKEMLQEQSSTKKAIKPGKLDKGKKVCVATNLDVSKRTKKGKRTLNAASSLDKFKEMKKIISKTERKLNKLPVVINSGPTLCKVVTSDASAIDVSDQPVVVIEKCSLVHNRPVASSSKRKIDKANVMDNEIYNFSKPLNVVECRLTRIDYVNKNNKLQDSAGPETPNTKFSKSEKSKSTPGLRIKSSKIKEVEAENTNILTEPTKENEKSAKNSKEKDDNIFNKLTQSMNEAVRQVDILPDIDDDIFNVKTQSLFIDLHKISTNVYEPDKQLGELDLPQQVNECMKILTNTVGLLQNYLVQLNPKTKEYVGNFINDTLKTINRLLHPDQEVSNMQSTLPIANLVDMAIQTDLPILSLENNLAETAVQTDFNSPQRGLYISSTDMFNTPSVADAEIQTEFLPCSNCDHQIINSTTKAANRGILSESFDNLQFETQDFLKAKRNVELRSQIITNIKNQASSNDPSPTCKATKDTSKRLPKQNSTDGLFAKDDGFDNIQFDTQQVLKNMSNLEVQPMSLDKTSDVDTPALSNSPRRTSKRLCKQNLANQLLEKDDGFDKIQFIKTQDLLKGKQSLKVQSPPAASYKSPRRTSKRLRKASSAKDENFETEVTKSQHNLKEHSQPRTPTSSTKNSEIGSPNCDPPRRTSKRLRSHHTPEEELLPKDIKRNKYINEDAFLQFLSDEIESSNHPIEFDDSDFSKYEECLDNVLKKYGPNDVSKNPRIISQTISKTQNAIKECNVIINAACSEAITIENTENLDKTVKYVKQKPSPCTLLILQDEFSKDFDNTGKVVKSSETGKKVLQSEKVEKSIEKQVPCDLGDNFEEIDMSMENIPNHPSESTNIENLPQNAEENRTKSNNSNVKVLQNVVVPKEIDAALIEEFNKSLDDVFLSDSDVVETTPQKSKIVSCEELLSQAYYNPVAPLALPPLIESSPDVISSLDPPLLTCFNMTFAPPPAFQDLGNPEDINYLNESQDVTLKPESDSVQVVHNSRSILSSVTPDLFMEAHNMVTSTPAEASQIISHSLNLSPIRRTCQEPLKLQNPIEAAHSSMISPLNIVKSQNNFNPKNMRSFSTSTPRQKSILNFIKTKKPCVTCTRLSKPEVAIIKTLSEKNMFTYSINFNSSVTHLIVGVDDQQCLRDHTMKYISAVAAGVWIVSFNWIQECVIRNQIVPEEQFEVLDVSGIDGPKQSRLNRISNPLFRGYKIYISPPFQAVIEKDIAEVIINLGGEVVPTLNDLLKKNGKICIIIAEAKSSKDFKMYNSWLEKLKVITVEMEWLSRSVGLYEIVNFRHFALCSDENISDLGYPPELTSNLPFNSRSAYSNM